jgi:hypothetical protein
VWKNKALFGLIIFFFTFFTIGFSKVFAADITVTCNSSDCSLSGAPLFNELNIYPSYSVTKSIFVDNSNNGDSCNLYLFTQRQGDIGIPDLAGNINTVIKDGGTVYFGDDTEVAPKNLTDLFGQNIYLGSIGGGSTREYFWRSFFTSISGNEYQNKSVKFDFNINFTCGNEPSNNSTGGDGGTGGTTQTTSNVPAVLGAAITKLTNFVEDIIPYEEKPETLGETSEVLGLQCTDKYYPWWVSLLVQGILSLVILIVKAKKNNTKRLWITLIIFGLLSQLIHYLLGCNCATGDYCSKYWIYNTIIVSVFLFAFYLTSKKYKR